MTTTILGRAALAAVLAGMMVVCAGCGRGAGADSSEDAYDLGWNFFRLAEFEIARKHFEASLKLATNETQRVRALSSLADAWNYNGGNQEHTMKKAADLYRRVIAEDSEKVWAPWAALAIARHIVWRAVDNFPDLAELEEAYGAVMRDYPGTMAAEEAFLYLQNARIARMDDAALAKSVEELEAWVEEHLESPVLSRAYAMLARGYHLQREGLKYIGALSRSAEIAKMQVQHENMPAGDQGETYFKAGTAAQFDAGDFELARKYYAMLIEESPVDQRVFIAEQHLEQMKKFEEEVREEVRREEVRREKGE